MESNGHPPRPPPWRASQNTEVDTPSTRSQLSRTRELGPGANESEQDGTAAPEGVAATTSRRPTGERFPIAINRDQLDGIPAAPPSPGQPTGDQMQIDDDQHPAGRARSATRGVRGRAAQGRSSYFGVRDEGISRSWSRGSNTSRGDGTPTRRGRGRGTNGRRNAFSGPSGRVSNHEMIMHGLRSPPAPPTRTPPTPPGYESTDVTMRSPVNGTGSNQFDLDWNIVETIRIRVSNPPPPMNIMVPGFSSNTDPPLHSSDARLARVEMSDYSTLLYVPHYNTRRPTHLIRRELDALTRVWARYGNVMEQNQYPMTDGRMLLETQNYEESPEVQENHEDGEIMERNNGPYSPLGRQRVPPYSPVHEGRRRPWPEFIGAVSGANVLEMARQNQLHEAARRNARRTPFAWTDARPASAPARPSPLGTGLMDTWHITTPQSFSSRAEPWGLSNAASPISPATSSQNNPQTSFADLASLNNQRRGTTSSEYTPNLYHPDYVVQSHRDIPRTPRHDTASRMDGGRDGESDYANTDDEMPDLVPADRYDDAPGEPAPDMFEDAEGIMREISEDTDMPVPVRNLARRMGSRFVEQEEVRFNRGPARSPVVGVGRGRGTNNAGLTNGTSFPRSGQNGTRSATTPSSTQTTARRRSNVPFAFRPTSIAMSPTSDTRRRPLAPLDPGRVALPPNDVIIANMPPHIRRRYFPRGAPQPPVNGSGQVEISRHAFVGAPQLPLASNGELLANLDFQVRGNVGQVDEAQGNAVASTYDPTTGSSEDVGTSTFFDMESGTEARRSTTLTSTQGAVQRETVEALTPMSLPEPAPGSSPSTGEPPAGRGDNHDEAIASNAEPASASLDGAFGSEQEPSPQTDVGTSVFFDTPPDSFHSSRSTTSAPRSNTSTGEDVPLATRDQGYPFPLLEGPENMAPPPQVDIRRTYNVSDILGVRVPIPEEVGDLERTVYEINGRRNDGFSIADGYVQNATSQTRGGYQGRLDPAVAPTRDGVQRENVTVRSENPGLPRADETSPGTGSTPLTIPSPAPRGTVLESPRYIHPNPNSLVIIATGPGGRNVGVGVIGGNEGLLDDVGSVMAEMLDNVEREDDDGSAVFTGRMPVHLHRRMEESIGEMFERVEEVVGRGNLAEGREQGVNGNGNGGLTNGDRNGVNGGNTHTDNEEEEEGD